MRKKERKKERKKKRKKKKRKRNGKRIKENEKGQEIRLGMALDWIADSKTTKIEKKN